MGTTVAAPCLLRDHCSTPPCCLQDVYSAAFAVLRAQQAAPPRYLQAALAEFVASCHAHGKVVAPPLATLYIDLLLDQVRHAWPRLLCARCAVAAC